MAARPTARVGPLQRGADRASSRISAPRFGAWMDAPTSAGAWRRMMVIARPKAKPRRTGRATKAVTAPRRAAAANRKRPPMAATIAVTSAACAAAPPGMAARVAARMAAEEEVVVTMAKRLLPIAA